MKETYSRLLYQLKPLEVTRQPHTMLVGQNCEYFMDFNEAYYGRKKISTRIRSSRSKLYKAVSIAPIWPEYRGHSSQHPYTYSPTLAKATHQHAMHVFQQAEYVLSKARSRE